MLTVGFFLGIQCTYTYIGTVKVSMCQVVILLAIALGISYCCYCCCCYICYPLLIGIVGYVTGHYWLMTGTFVVAFIYICYKSYRKQRLEEGIDEKNRWDVYLIKRQNNQDSLHHFLVLREQLTNHCRKIELTTYSSILTVAAGMAKATFLHTEYEGSHFELSRNTYKGTIIINQYLIDRYGREIVENDFDGKYSVMGNNCQEFCNKFLQKVGLQGYTTTSKAFKDLGQLFTQ